MSANPVSLKQVLDDVARALTQAGIESARMEARRLACWALGCDAAGLLTRDTIPEDARERLVSAVTRRCRREPMAMIERETGFWSLTLGVSEATLIPRGDSEALIEALLALRPNRGAVRTILDLGTGTGCLLLAALSEYPEALGVGIDLAPEAACLASHNAARNRLETRSVFLAGSWFAGLKGQFDLILSNPPYIPVGEIAGLMPEVRDYEPVRALAGGNDGLDAYRAILTEASDYLSPSGLVIFEIGQGQERDVTRIAQEKGLKLCEARADLGGIIRALCFERKDTPLSPGHE